MIRRHLGRFDLPAEVRVALEDEIVGAVVADSSRIFEANDHFLGIVGHTREELDAGSVSWLRMTDPKWLADDARAIGQIRAAGRSEVYEKEYVTADGSLVPITLFNLQLEPEPLRIFAFIVRSDDAEAVRLVRLAAGLT